MLYTQSNVPLVKMGEGGVGGGLDKNLFVVN